MANLQYGSTGEDVKKLQTQLMNLGYDVGDTKADGIFGEKTMAALRSYQADQGLNSDGIVGENTYEALYGTFMPAEMREQAPAKPGAPAATTPVVQPGNAVQTKAQPAQAQGYAQLLPKQQNEQLTAQLKGLYGESGAYAQALAAQKKANDAAVEKAVGALETQKTATNRSYADLFKQLYLDKMRNQKNIGQQMAAQGITGGAAESTLLELGTSYEEALRQGEQSRIGAMEELDRAITDTRLTGEISGAEAAAANAKERTDGYAAVLQNLISRNDSRIAAAEQRKASDAENERAYAYQTAMQILRGGSVPSVELLRAAGISGADAQAIVGQVQAAKEQSAEKSPYSEAQAEIALGAAVNGDRSELVKNIVEGYYGVPLETALTAYVEGYEPPSEDPGLLDEEWDGVGMKPAHFDAYKRSIVQTIQSGFSENVQSMIDDIWGELSPAQQTQLQEELSKLGLRYEQ